MSRLRIESHILSALLTDARTNANLISTRYISIAGITELLIDKCVESGVHTFNLPDNGHVCRLFREMPLPFLVL